jgi:hypothetical protein
MCRRKFGSVGNLSLMVLILEGLRIDLSAKYTTPSTLSSKSSKKSLQNVMWEVAPVLRSYESPQEENELLNNSSINPILQWETM